MQISLRSFLVKLFEKFKKIDEQGNTTVYITQRKKR